MSEMNGYAIVLRAVRGLNAAKSWTGKTHVIKSLYIASTKADLPFEFVLFKHGPYSFDANDAIESMSAIGVLEMMATPPYGVRLKPGRTATSVRTEIEPQIVDAIDSAIRLVGESDVKALEAIATSVWVHEKKHVNSENEWQQEVQNLKPHLDKDLIADAIKRARTFLTN